MPSSPVTFLPILATAATYVYVEIIVQIRVAEAGCCESHVLPREQEQQCQQAGFFDLQEVTLAVRLLVKGV